MKKWRTPYLTILTIITVCAVLVGSAVHIAGVQIGSFGASSDESDDTYTKTYSNSLTESSQELGSFNQIKVTAEMANLEITSGKNSALTSKADKDDEITYEIDNGVLKINERRKKSWRFLPFLRVRQGGKITLTVAQGTSLEKTDLQLNMGNVTVTDLKPGQLDIHADMGNITASGCECGDVTLDANMGNIKVDTFTFDTMTAASDMGNVKISLSEPLESMDLSLSTSMGNVHVNGEKVAKSYETKGNGGKKLTAQTDMGNIKIQED